MSLARVTRSTFKTGIRRTEGICVFLNAHAQRVSSVRGASGLPRTEDTVTPCHLDIL